MKDGWVIIDIISVVNEDGWRVVVILNNVYYLENLYFIIDGVDIYYFVKLGFLEGDLVILGFSGGWWILENGINVIVF